MQLIGLTGRAGTGKDTVAQFLCETHGFVQIALADPIRAGLKAMLGLTDNQLADRQLKEQRIDWINRSPRWLAQTLGTEWGRCMVHPNLWLTVAERKIATIKATPPCYHVSGIVISDIRFENEADWLRDLGGEVWHIRRPSALLAGETANHSSEQEVPVHDRDAIIHNIGTIDALHDQIAGLLIDDSAKKEAA